MRIRRRRSSLPFLGIDELGDQPHVIVDGAERPGTALVLSHWPHSPTPERFANDLSVEIVFSYLRGRSHLGSHYVAVTNDHFDEDGLASVFGFVNPDTAWSLKDRLIAFGRVGDFGVVHDRLIARAALVVRALSDPERSPIFDGASDDERIGNARTTLCYEELLPRLPEILANPGNYHDLIVDNEERYVAGLKALERGEVVVEDHSDLGLAVVHVAEAVDEAHRVPFGHHLSLPIHPWVLHSATEHSRMLIIEPGRPCYYDRYETWVRYTSRRLPLRRDLGPLAEQLCAEEHTAVWGADSPSAIVAGLSAKGESDIEPRRLIGVVADYLEHSSPAWFPFPNRS